jgi:hypothetical protein
MTRSKYGARPAGEFADAADVAALDPRVPASAVAGMGGTTAAKDSRIGIPASANGLATTKSGVAIRFARAPPAAAAALGNTRCVTANVTSPLVLVTATTA